MAEKRYFAFRKSGNGKEEAVFTGRQPRQAALKAASRGFTDIYLRERGSKKIHHFKGSRKLVAAPENRPDWMAEKVMKPSVKKMELIKPVKKAAKKVVAKKKAAKKIVKKKKR